MARGFAAKTLTQKLGMRSGMRVMIVNEPAKYAVLIADAAGDIQFVTQNDEPVELIHFFTNTIDEYWERLPLLKNRIKKNGTIWVSWYKKTSGMPTELTENMIKEIALANGMVDVKVCAVDELWSGLKLVYRLKDR